MCNRNVQQTGNWGAHPEQVLVFVQLHRLQVLIKHQEDRVVEGSEDPHGLDGQPSTEVSHHVASKQVQTYSISGGS